MMRGRWLLPLLGLLGALALMGCVPDDPAPVWVGPLPLDSGVCEVEVYPCGTVGTEPCDLIEDLEFIPVNDPARALAGDDGVLALRDVYADDTVAGVLVFGTAGWCQFCSQEGAWLETIYANYQEVNSAGQRVEFIAVVFQDDFGSPATESYAEAYATRRGFTFPAVADPSGGVLRYFDPSGAPGNVFINRDDMLLQGVIQGFDQEEIEDGLDALDGTATCQ